MGERALASRYLFVWLLAVVVLAGCGSDDAEEPAGSAASAGNVGQEYDASATDAATALITENYIRGIIAEISSDAYEGRGPGTRGDVKTRSYLAAQMEQLGLSPGGPDGGWEQPFDLVGLKTEQPSSWTFTGANESLSLQQWDDYMINSGIQERHTEVSDAEVVFAGYAIQAPEYDWDDFKGADLNGKVLLIMNNDPDWDPDLFAGETRLWYGRWDYKRLNAARQGAVGAIIIHTTASAGYPFQVLQASNSPMQFELPAGDEPRLRIKAWMTEDAARRLVAAAGKDLDELREAAYNRDFRPVPLGIRTSISMDVEIESVASANVLGLIPGSDPELRDEVVIYSAHHDHLGIGPPNEEGDTIYNGALDNAAGIGLVMGIARAFRGLPVAPRRSVLFAFVGAEEQGLLGSEWYAKNPTFPPGKIAANLNYDGGNVWGRTHDAIFIGLGKSSIDPIVIALAAEQGRVIKPDQYADRGYFYRSDQFNFARIGVPAVYMDPGTDYIDRPEDWGREQQDRFNEVDYHQPSDEYDPSWNLDGMIDDAVLGFRTGLAISNADEMPRWNAGDEFEAVRLEALAAEEQ